MKKIILDMNTLSPLYMAEDSNNGVNYVFKTPVIYKGCKTKVPYIPGNSYKGRIRRKIAQAVFDSWIEKGVVIPVELYVGMTAGAASASNEASNINAKVLKEAQDNPYMGLLGGGKYLIRSGIQTSFGFPVCEETVGAGIIDAESDEVPVIVKDGEYLPLSAKELLGYYLSIRKDDLMSLSDYNQAKLVIQDGDNSILEYQQGVLKSRQARKETGATKEDVSNMMTFEAIVPGSKIRSEIILLPHLSDTHLAVLMVALHKMAEESVFGGKTAAGFGKIKLTATLEEDGEQFPLIDEQGLTETGEKLYSQGISALQNLEHEQMLQYFV